MLWISECNPILNKRIIAPSWANAFTAPSAETKCGSCKGKTGKSEFKKPDSKGQISDTDEGEISTPNKSRTITTGWRKYPTSNTANTADKSRKEISNQILFSSGTSPNRLARITEK